MANAFVFPGQGSQFSGMAKNLYESNPFVKNLFEQANEILGFRISDIMFTGSDDDLKQMYAYNLYWNAKKSMLLYPHSKSVEESFGKFWKGAPTPEDNQCKVGFVSVLDENNYLDTKIGEKIIEKLI